VPGYEVLAWDDVRKMLEHTAGAKAVGCEDDGCLSEIGGALGVEYLVAGNIGGLGTSYTMTVKLIDIGKAKTLARESEVVVGDIGGLLGKIPGMVQRLLGQVGADLAGVKPGVAGVKTPVISIAGAGSLTDARDGKSYRTVRIGNQTWMAENLNYSTDLSSCANDDQGNCGRYGRLYDWSAARSACPSGWHLPSDGEWETLAQFVVSQVGGAPRGCGDDCTLLSGVGRALKATTANGSDMFGFAAVPGGWREMDGSFQTLGTDADWWSSTPSRSGVAWYRSLHVGDENFFRYNYYRLGQASVRCLQDGT
jgi:uncharacterized protein (TIGR02145 family)